MDISIIELDISEPGPSTVTTTATEEVAKDDDKQQPKRKRRAKEEIEAEKMEKEVKRIRREMNSAKNSKCEQFLFCYVDRSVCLLDDSIEQELKNRFVERAVPDQLAFVDGEYGFGKVIWKRKRIDAIIEEGKVKSLQTMDPEGCFIHVLEGGAFNQLIKKNEFQKFVENVSKEHKHCRSLPNIV
uniref:Uncharacterized protein n=1 Tax=Panagrolaimus davidi TaxID=227884 RepID=A0A914RAJ0_9BILA